MGVSAVHEAINNFNERNKFSTCTKRKGRIIDRQYI